MLLETFLKIFETETGLLIERSAGYWSFSHLTFQEYFVAQKILEIRMAKLLIQRINSNY
jgi:predicted NACHT family NTPase